MRAGAKLISFRIYPENRSLYAQVNIWPTKTAMYAHKPLGRNHEASCSGQQLIYVPPKSKDPKQRRRKIGLFAELNFYRARLGVEVISHEMTHAAFCWAERRRLNLANAIGEHNWQIRKHDAVLDQDGTEERFCYALGQMVRQFTQKCYDLGLYKEVVES